uniref:Uncharacterized protein n=1 Tax=viral metagenome TaxID=1070528 RepID=A0A6M3IFF1_9ZZZZ
MAKLLLIAAPTLNPTVNQVGDVVGIFEDTHQFSPAEIGGFEVVNIPGLSRSQVEARLGTRMPKKERASRLPVGANIWTLDFPEDIQVWDDKGTFKRIVRDWKYAVSLNGLSELEKMTAKNGSVIEKLAVIDKFRFPTFELAENQSVVVVEKAKAR